ncbi:MAG: DUF1338 family protein [Pirellulaceae bacterium]
MNLDDGQAVDQCYIHHCGTPTVVDYDRLADESEYAAWVIYNRYCLNHFTISVHNLPHPTTRLKKFNDFGGVQRIPPERLGGQKSRPAPTDCDPKLDGCEMVAAEFDDGRQYRAK